MKLKRIFKNYMSFVFILIMLSNCKNENINKDKLYTLLPSDDSIIIKLSKNEINHTICNQYFTENNINYLATLCRNRNSIYLYNLDQKKLIKEIVIKKEGVNSFPGFLSFVVKNTDTIILISNYPGKIGIFNSNGDILKVIPINKDDEGKIIHPAVPYLGQKGCLADSILYLLQVYRNDEEYSDKFTSEMQKQSDLFFSVNLKTGSVKSIHLKYPEDIVGIDVFNMENFFEIGYEGYLVYGSSLLKNFYITKGFSNFKKVTIQTEYDLKLPENMTKYGSDLEGFLKYSVTRDNLLALYFDKYRDSYYLLLQKKLDGAKQKSLSKTNFIYPNCMILIFNKNFINIGSVDFPENTYSLKNLFITKKGVYISEDHVDNPTYNEDVMRYRLFKLKEID
jgi:hypothetical protein